MGARRILPNEGLRRLLVNACYWALGMEDKIPPSPRSAWSGRITPALRHRSFHQGRQARAAHGAQVGRSDRSPSLSRQAKRLQCVRDAQVGDRSAVEVIEQARALLHRIVGVVVHDQLHARPQLGHVVLQIGQGSKRSCGRRRQTADRFAARGSFILAGQSTVSCSLRCRKGRRGALNCSNVSVVVSPGITSFFQVSTACTWPPFKLAAAAKKAVLSSTRRCRSQATKPTAQRPGQLEQPQPLVERQVRGDRRTAAPKPESRTIRSNRPAAAAFSSVSMNLPTCLATTYFPSFEASETFPSCGPCPGTKVKPQGSSRPPRCGRSS